MGDRLAMVQSVTEAGVLAGAPDDALREILERVRAGLPASAAAILLPDEADPEVLVVRASVGAAKDGSVPAAVDAAAGGPVSARHRPATLRDIAGARSGSGDVAGAGSVAVVPLTVGGSPLGVLHVASDEPGGFDEDMVARLGMLADHVALAVDRIRANERATAAEAALRAGEERARAVLDGAVDGIVTIDTGGRVASMNRAAEEIFGYRAGEVVGRDVSLLMPKPFRGTRQEPAAFRRTAQRATRRREVAGRRRDGTTFPMELAVSEIGAEPALFIANVRDITEWKRLEERLTHHALHDSLTGLANRALLLDRLHHARVRLRRHPGTLALLFLDLDGFKLVNDTLGHDAGDELLVQVANRLRSCQRPEDLVARLGGDEFAVLCEDLPGPAEALEIAARLVERMKPPVRVRGREVFVSASVGVVTDAGARAGEELLRDADGAMYQAKKQGGARHVLLGPGASPARHDPLQLSSDLHRALERGQMRACYQPLIDLATGEVSAAEALIRWEHPHGGVISPAGFLDVADQTGVIRDLDAWMIATACRDSAEWSRRLRRAVGVWVNLSGRSLADPRLPDTVARALAASRLDPPLLTLEVTEGTLMRNAAETARTLETLRGLDVRLAVDDFGTGYSSLAYLQQFPVDTLKVDRSFVAGLGQDAPDSAASAAIIRAVVHLASALELRTVAEGVETPEQLAAVASLGCDIGQGFFLGRPAPSDDIPVAVANGVLLPDRDTATYPGANLPEMPSF